MKHKYLKIIADGMRKDAALRDALMKIGVDATDFSTGLEDAVVNCLIEELDEVQYDEFMAYVYDTDKDWPL